MKMLKKQINLVILLTILVVADRIELTIGQQEEKFFYNADFSAENAQRDVQGAESRLSPFPNGPLHVSLGLRSQSGDNRPTVVEPIGAASVQAQVEEINWLINLIITGGFGFKEAVRSALLHHSSVLINIIYWAELIYWIKSRLGD